MVGEVSCLHDNIAGVSQGFVDPHDARHFRVKLVILSVTEPGLAVNIAPLAMIVPLAEIEIERHPELVGMICGGGLDCPDHLHEFIEFLVGAEQGDNGGFVTIVLFGNPGDTGQVVTGLFPFQCFHDFNNPTTGKDEGAGHQLPRVFFAFPPSAGF